MTPTLETLPVELLQIIALYLRHINFKHFNKLRLTSKTIKVKVQHIFLQKFSRQQVSFIPCRLTRLYNVVHHEEFGAARTDLTWLQARTQSRYFPRKGYEPLLNHEYGNRSTASELRAIMASQIETVGVEGLDAGTAMLFDYMRHMPNLRHLAYSCRQSDHSIRFKQIVSTVALAGTRLTSFSVRESANVDNSCIPPLFDLPYLVDLEKFELSLFHTTSSDAQNGATDYETPLLTCLMKMHSLQELNINNRNVAEKFQIGPYLTWNPQISSLRSLELHDTTFCEAHVSLARLFLSHHRNTLRKLRLFTCSLTTSSSRPSGTVPVDWPAVFRELKHFSALEDVYLTGLEYDKQAGYFAAQGKVDMRYAEWVEDIFDWCFSFRDHDGEGAEWVWVDVHRDTFESATRDDIRACVEELPGDFRLGDSEWG